LVIATRHADEKFILSPPQVEFCSQKAVGERGYCNAIRY